MSRWLAMFLVTTALTGCSLYRADLAQGNSITPESLRQLKPNLTKHQVQQIMGTPALTPYFELDQWNYNYASIDGLHRDQLLKYKTITLYFKNNKLESYTSNEWHAENLPKHK